MIRKIIKNYIDAHAEKNKLKFEEIPHESLATETSKINIDIYKKIHEYASLENIGTYLTEKTSSEVSKYHFETLINIAKPSLYREIAINEKNSILNIAKNEYANIISSYHL